MAESVIELRKKLQSARSTVARYRGETQQATKRLVNGTMTIAGGGLVGMIRGYSDGPGYIAGTEITYETALATALGVLGVFDAAGDYSDELGSIGAGMGAAIAAPMVQSNVAAMRKK